MVIGDGVLTPALSVFSAVSGVELAMAKEHHKCSEAMFADLGHFSQLSIQIAFTSFVYPSLILAYMGQAAYLSQHHVIENDYRIGFYISVPKNLRVPVLLIALLAAVVGSQAIITGTFSIIKQCSSLGCFPRVKIVHTSSKFHGQIYIPEINWILMMLCLAVTIGFRDTKRMGNASGLAVITVMLVTTCLMSLVIVLCWHQSVFLAIGFVVLFGTIEAMFFSASVIKFLEGAWVPIALSLIFMLVMYVWHYVPVPHVGHEERFLVGHIGPREHRVYRCIVRYGYRDIHKDDVEFEKDLVCSVAEFIRKQKDGSAPDGLSVNGELCSDDEAMTVVGTPSTHLEGVQLRMGQDGPSGPEVQEIRASPVNHKRRVRFVVPESPKIDDGSRAELRDLHEAREAGVAYILGHAYVQAKQGSGLVKRMVINLGYEFLRRNSRTSTDSLTVPHASTLEVGMVYHV
ncbi:hypothetical protein L1987_87749 [Smallanthus sonchifolius]|nr:hypothetical protein L1987_87749 [Smallanthus sonchifolius]